jgi:predicted MarR family transcription regulator
MPIPNLDEYSKKKAKSLVSVRSTGDGKTVCHRYTQIQRGRR